MACEKKQRLLAEYHEAVSEWGEAIQHLKEQAGIDSNDYMILEKFVDKTGSKTILAKVAYTKHVAEHHC